MKKSLKIAKKELFGVSVDNKLVFYNHVKGL